MVYYLGQVSVPTLVLLTVSGLILFRHLIKRLVAPSLPPGPKGWPLIGYALKIPFEKQWLAFAQWGEIWGDICSVTAFGQPLIIVNSVKVATDMLEKKSSFYSDRPILPMLGELVGFKNSLIFSQYDDHFRQERKLFHQLFGTHSTIRQFTPAIELEVHRMLKNLSRNPDDLSAQFRRAVGAISARISHGYRINEEPGSDPFIDMAEAISQQFSIASAPGAFLIDTFPVLRYVPEWFPGAGFKKTARVWAAALDDMVNFPHNYVKQQMAAGTAERSFTSTLLEERPEEEDLIKWAAASIFAAGSDTTVSTIEALFLALTLYPEVQSKAQAELDSVIGSDRLPGFVDRESLPYINAICKEVFRWHTVAPMGFPHRASKNDIHDGHLIPKGSLIIPNIWKMTHDPQIYSNPMTFDPMRFMNVDSQRHPEKDPYDMCFGFGRRVCPGKLLADASVFIACVMALAVFDISQRIENGVAVEPVHEQTSGTVSHPAPYKCSFKARSAKAAALVQGYETS